MVHDTEFLYDGSVSRRFNLRHLRCVQRTEHSTRFPHDEVVQQAVMHGNTGRFACNQFTIADINTLTLWLPFRKTTLILWSLK